MEPGGYSPASLEVAGEVLLPVLLANELAVLEKLPRARVVEVLAIAREDHHALPAKHAAGELHLFRVLAAHRRFLGLSVFGFVRDLLGITFLAPREAMGALVGRDDRRPAGARIAVDRRDLPVGGGRLHLARLVSPEPRVLVGYR